MIAIGIFHKEIIKIQLFFFYHFKSKKEPQENPDCILYEKNLYFLAIYFFGFLQKRPAMRVCSHTTKKFIFLPYQFILHSLGL